MGLGKTRLGLKDSAVCLRKNLPVSRFVPGFQTGPSFSQQRKGKRTGRCRENGRGLKVGLDTGQKGAFRNRELHNT